MPTCGAGLYTENFNHTRPRPWRTEISQRSSALRTRSSPLPGRCCQTWMRAPTSNRLFRTNGRFREEARQAAETALTLQPNLGEAVWAKGHYHYACLKDYDAAVHYFEQARQFLPNGSRIPTRWPMSSGGEASGTTARVLQRSRNRTLDPRNVTLLNEHAIFLHFGVVFPRRCESLTSFLISHPTTWLTSR